MAKVRFEKWDDPMTARAFGGTFEYLYRVYAGSRHIGVIEKSIGGYEYNEAGKLVRPVMVRFVPDYETLRDAANKWDQIIVADSVNACKAAVRERFA